jgi:hypothetical protein
MVLMPGSKTIGEGVKFMLKNSFLVKKFGTKKGILLA